MSETASATCQHCYDPIIAFIMQSGPSTGKPGMWYRNVKPKPRPAMFGRPAETEEDLAGYKPWNDQIRTVPCKASPNGRHAPIVTIEEELNNPKVVRAAEWLGTHPPGARLPEMLEP